MRRRESIASAAMFALSRSRSDPRINLIMSENRYISPSSSTNSFSHLDNISSPSRDYSTDSPRSMSISSTSSGPGQSLVNLSIGTLFLVYFKYNFHQKKLLCFYPWTLHLLLPFTYDPTDSMLTPAKTYLDNTRHHKYKNIMFDYKYIVMDMHIG